jgi:thymidylate synthase
VRATAEWRNLLDTLLLTGTEIAPTSMGGDWRGRTTKERLCVQTVVPMTRPVVLCPGRRLRYRFMAAETAWILSGDNRVGAISAFAPALVKLSDDGRTMSGAYGPPFIDQLSFVTRALAKDPASRQAVISLWRPSPALGLEIPCTLSLQFLIREGAIHTHVAMRSSDVWLGLPYDWHAFSMMTAYLVLVLRATYPDLRLGLLTVTAGSQHLYAIDWENAQACADRTDLSVPDLAPLNLAQLGGPEDLIAHLWAVANGQASNLKCHWLTELMS